MKPTGVIDLPCQLPVADTVNRLMSVLRSKGLTVFTRIDQAAEAEAAGLTMRPMVLVIFGDPKAGTPLMLKHPALAIDLPLKALIWEAADGKVWLSYNSPDFYQQRHGLEIRPFEAVEGILKAATQ